MIRLPFFFAVLAIALASGTAKSIDLYYPLHGVYQIKDGVWTVAQHTETELLLIGEGLAVGDEITFTQSSENCKERADLSTIRITSVDQVEGRVNVTLSETGVFYFCLGDQHQGEFVVLESKNEDKFTIPLPISILLVLVFLVLSALFNGLNIGLLSLSPSELKMVAEAGEGKDQRYADIILPIRRTGNRLLCTILLGCALANSSSAIFLDELVGGGVAGVLGSTMCIVIFGEIVPQSVCSRHALYVGAKTLWLTKFFLIVTFPVSFPISFVLDCILGDEASAVYMRKQLLHLLKMQDPYNDLERDEVDIITGALTYKNKTASMVMTKLDDVFMLDINSILDFKTVSKIIDTGHSRIPTYRDARDNIVGVLYVKDLAFIDPDDKTPLESVIKYYRHPIEEVYSTTHLDSMLELFKQGRTHMVLVIHIDNEDPDRDPTPEVVGIATLEDVIEEIIQSEIIDETDRFVDNKTKLVVRRESELSALPPTAFAERDDVNRLSDKVALVVFTYLSTQLELFSANIVSPVVLKKLVSRPECVVILQREDLTEAQLWLYREGQPSDTFTLVIEGTLKVTVGKDRFEFEAGPYHAICLSALTNPEFICDFSALISSDKVVLLRISRRLYLEALAATQIAHQHEQQLHATTPTNRQQVDDGNDQEETRFASSTEGERLDLAARSVQISEPNTASLIAPSAQVIAPRDERLRTGEFSHHHPSGISSPSLLTPLTSPSMLSSPTSASRLMGNSANARDDSVA
eukprot:m.153654 g.153654  ORF g.153654 m.153654 type:complete len:751 (-) comp16240_c4_seq4:125-2377(-)